MMITSDILDALTAKVEEALTARAHECPGVGCELTEEECYHRHQPIFSARIGDETHIDGSTRTIARIAVEAIQGQYVPPPPGSDRDALPPEIRKLAQPYMPPYWSTACMTAHSLKVAAGHLRHQHDEELREQLLAYALKQNQNCRKTRKQDLVKCSDPYHVWEAEQEKMKQRTEEST